MGSPEILIFGESGGTSRPFDLAERYRYYELVAEREGELSEWSKEPHSKCGIRITSYRGFESLTLRKADKCRANAKRRQKTGHESSIKNSIYVMVVIFGVSPKKITIKKNACSKFKRRLSSIYSGEKSISSMASERKHRLTTADV